MTFEEFVLGYEYLVCFEEAFDFFDQLLFTTKLLVSRRF